MLHKTMAAAAYEIGHCPAVEPSALFLNSHDKTGTQAERGADSKNFLPTVTEINRKRDSLRERKKSSLLIRMGSLKKIGQSTAGKPGDAERPLIIFADSNCMLSKEIPRRFAEDHLRFGFSFKTSLLFYSFDRQEKAVSVHLVVACLKEQQKILERKQENVVGNEDARQLQ